MSQEKRPLDQDKLKQYSKNLFGHLTGALTSSLVYLGDQLSPESRTLLLVPPRGSAQVQLCLSSDNETVGHRSSRMSFFTFSQVSTSSGFCSCC